jgi:hypothetical protein
MPWRWIISLGTTKDNVRQIFALSNRINPETGEYKLVAATRTTTPGGWMDFPVDEAARLIKVGAARAPTAEEMTLRRLAGLPTE